MASRGQEEVPCVTRSAEFFYRGLIAGGIVGAVLPSEGSSLAARSTKTALYAGTWCLTTSLGTCAMSSVGFDCLMSGMFGGLFSGATLGLASRSPRKEVGILMLGSAAFNVWSSGLLTPSGVE
eukprot:NODE_20096_length_813_cov_3.567055.p1 GENE.NODE_20096_length_813_cov_3.567055~~NODE_20096_length_813_cov_3.567055.p1  ORF type:complete len:123 (-),score=14.23 NODE_20096_length_813_cov_3.567055:337-705(-)